MSILEDFKGLNIEFELDENMFFIRDVFIFIQKGVGTQCDNTMYCSGRDIHIRLCEKYNYYKKHYECKSIKQYLEDNPDKLIIIENKIEEYLIGEL
ncbi:MAG: hypothetical protein H7836_04620 [Magnetococcus sp. YQC-3]